MKNPGFNFQNTYTNLPSCFFTETNAVSVREPTLVILNEDLSKDINLDLQPLNNLSDKEATELTGLKGHSLELMRDRHWSMPFLNPPENKEEDINISCKRFNVEIFRGNRMSHLL